MRLLTPDQVEAIGGPPPSLSHFCARLIAPASASSEMQKAWPRVSAYRAKGTRKGVAFKPYSYSGFEKLVQNLRKQISGVPGSFTLDACRHGGMTELEEAALTEGQGRALSGHKTAQAYRGYAKETFDRALSATRKRHAHRLANEAGTNVRNEGRIGVRNEISESKTTNVK
jgi:hypothetical protein